MSIINNNTIMTIGNGLEYDPEKHIYTINGRRVPSVTQIVDMVTDRYIARTPLIEQAALRGTLIHELTAAYDWGDLRDDDLDADSYPYLQAYASFCNDYHPDWKYIELALGNRTNGSFAGTVDRIGSIDGELRVVDIKTTQNFDRTAKLAVLLQLSGYFALCISNGIRPSYQNSGLAVQLKSDGTYRVHTMPDMMKSIGMDLLDEPMNLFLDLATIRNEIDRYLTAPKRKDTEDNE